MKKKKKLWIVDALSFVGFLFSLKPSITGYAVHEWLGLAVGGVLLVHLLMHSNWILCVMKNFGSVKAKMRLNFMIDLFLGISFLLILITGVIISDILSLILSARIFLFVRNVHVISSYAALGLLFIKIGTHVDWIVNTTKGMFGFKSRAVKKPILAISANEISSGAMCGSENPNLVAKNQSRREFMRLTVFGGLGIVVAGKGLLDWNQAQQDFIDKSSQDSITSNQNTDILTTAETNSQPVLVSNIELDPLLEGVSACRKGFQCEYPGRCHDYQDVNNNGLCDLGEVLAFSLAAQSIAIEPSSPSNEGEIVVEDLDMIATSSVFVGEESFEESGTENQRTGRGNGNGSGKNKKTCPYVLHCSYPGNCSLYRDEDRNGLCDLGEATTY